MDSRYEMVVANVSLVKSTNLGTVEVSIPAGRVVAMGNVVAGNVEDRIINLGILLNNNEVIKPCDYRFSEKTNGGEWLQSMRPVDFEGGSQYEVRYTAPTASVNEDLKFQVVFVIQKPFSY